jgi:hypothetical protein
LGHRSLAAGRISNRSLTTPPVWRSRFGRLARTDEADQDADANRRTFQPKPDVGNFFRFMVNSGLRGLEKPFMRLYFTIAGCGKHEFCAMS